MALNTTPTFFVSDGKLITDLGKTDTGMSVIQQADGKLVVAGTSNDNFAAIRYNLDGTLDKSFGRDGVVTTDFLNLDIGFCVIQQSDGKLVVSGKSGNSFALVRYNFDGTLDTTFDGDGKLTTDFGMSDAGYSVIQQSDGKLVVAGGNLWAINLVRYNLDGSLDKSFDGDGIVTSEGYGGGAFCVIQQADGKLVITGIRQGSVVVARYNLDGKLDTTFDSDGVLTTDLIRTAYGYSIIQQADGKLLVAGATQNITLSSMDFALVRYNLDGTLDTTFDTDGKLATDFGGSEWGYSVIQQTDGKLVVVGGNGDITIARYNLNGSLDNTFDGDGKLTTNFGADDLGLSLIQQKDGKLVVTGFTGDNKGSSTNSGKPVVRSGTSDFVLARYNLDGSLDLTFSPAEDTLLQSGPISIFEQNSAVIAPKIMVLDSELAFGGNYSGSSLSLFRNDGANSQDLFSNVGTLTSLVEGSYFGVDNITIGRVVTNSGGTLTLAFNSNATQSLVNKAMQQIAYSNSSDAPPPSLQIGWTFNDGNNGAQGSGGAKSVTGITTIQIKAVNDAPYVANPLPALKVQIGATLNYPIPSNTFIDPDGEIPKFSLSMANGTGLPPWLKFNTTTNTLTGTPVSFDAGTLSLVLTATDGSGAVASNVFTLTTAVNAPPSLKISTDRFSKFEVEYNDDRNFATPFTNSLSGSLSNSNDVDWYSVKFNAIGSQTVTFDTLTMTFGAWNVYWYDPSMQVMSGRNIGPSFNGVEPFTYSFPVVSNGTYYLRVQSTAPAFYNGGSYNIYFSQTDQLTYTDTVADDSFTNKSGTLIGSDTDAGTTFTYDIAGATGTGTTVSKVGSYGTLTVNKVSGDFIFTPNDAAIEALKTNAAETYVVSVSDGMATTTNSYTLTFSGADDPTSFSGAITGIVSEDGILKANGILNAIDRDSGDSQVVNQVNTAGVYGVFNIAANGAWTYDLNNSASNVQSLWGGQTVNDIFSITTVGGVNQNIVITVSGANDPLKIALSSDKKNLKAGESAMLTFTLSEPSTNFIASDVTATGGTLSNFTGSGTSYSALFTPTANSTSNGSVSVASGVFTDAAGNTNADGADANNTITLTVDTLLPTISVSSNKTNLQGGDAAALTFTLSEASTNFVASDITIVGGTLSNFTGSGTSYTATFTLELNNAFNGTISVANGAFTDAAGNKNADGSDANNSVNFSRIPTLTNETHTLSVIVDKNVLGVEAILLKDLRESMTFTNGAMTKHVIEYSGLTFDYNQIDPLISTVTRDGEFTVEYTKEINDYLGTQLNITYSAAVKLVGAASIDAVILAVAGADGNFVG